MHQPQLLFSGGSGRSGTTVLAKLLRTHPRVRASKPLEVRCVTDAAGLLDLCVGPREDAGWKVKALAQWQPLLLREFRKRMRTRWWSRVNRLGRDSGLHRGITTEQREQLLSTFERELSEDPISAAQAFLTRLARDQGLVDERYWIDTSPPNIANADRIHALIPEARFVHMVRDGRDTIASVLAETWGPKDVHEAAHWWANRMAAAHRALARVPAEQVLTLSLEELVVTDRVGQYERLLSFLELPDRPRMRRYFAERMPTERVAPGSWGERVGDPAALDRAYQEAAAELVDRGIPIYEHP